MVQVFTAGSDTTGATLKWALLFMAQNPNVQAKVQNEIDAVIGEKSLDGGRVIKCRSRIR